MFTVAALYKFTPFPDPAALRAPLAGTACAHGVKGPLLLAREGINGTIAGTREGIDAVLAHIRGLPGCADLEWKESEADEMPFGRMKVRLKREIVTMGQPDVDPTASVGAYVDPANWTGNNAIPLRLWEHVSLAGASIVIGALVALPIGLYIGHTGRAARVAQAITNVGRAVPSLAPLARARRWPWP